MLCRRVLHSEAFLQAPFVRTDAIEPNLATAMLTNAGEVLEGLIEARIVAFWGGIDSLRILHAGSPREMRADVGWLSEILGKDGGYVLASVHNVQADVLPEDVIAGFEAGRDCIYRSRKASVTREPRS